MSVDSDKLSQAVSKVESAPTSEEIIEQKVDEIQAGEKLESETQERLVKVFKGETSTPEEEPEDKGESTPEKEPEEESTPEEKSAEESEGEEKEPAGEPKTDGEEKPADDKKNLPDAYVRAAIHQGWTAKEVDEFFKEKPEQALKTFAKMYESTNTLSNEFAAIGRAKQQLKTQPQSEKKEETKLEFKALDITKLKEEYPDDPIVSVVETLQQQNKLLVDKVNSLNVTAPDTTKVEEDKLRLKLQEEELVEKQINQFFGSSELGGYLEFYGKLQKEAKNWDSLTGEQRQRRWELLQLADQIIIGAESQGRKMPVEEAMNRAHLVVSKPVSEKIIRDKIKSNVTSRAKSLSLQPNKTLPKVPGKSATQGDLEGATEQRLAKVFK